MAGLLVVGGGLALQATGRYRQLDHG